jgi:phosphoglycerate dehydrogenase-like enzyme
MPDPIEVLITLPFNEALLSSLREVSPRLHFTLQAARRVEEISPEVWARTEVLYTDRVLPDPARVPSLRWIQFHYAGIDFAADSPLLKKPDLVATHLSGASAIQVAEYVVMMMLALGHHLPDLMDSQAKVEWPRERNERFIPLELHNSTVGIIGYGSIGRQITRLLQPFGVTVLATKREVMRPQDSGYFQEGLGDPQGDLFQRLYPVQALKSMLHACDFIVVTVPLTPETRGLVGAEELAAAKPTAYLIDTSRGGVVDHTALVAALEERRLAGAALDVFPEEPLSSSSPLWRLPNVIITPHISGSSLYYNERAVTLFAENLNRYLAGLPLYNRFDPAVGY